MLRKAFVFLVWSMLGVSCFGSIWMENGMEIEAVIFDCDGVLVDTEYQKFLAWKLVCEKRGIEIAIEEFAPVIGYSSAKIRSHLSSLKGVEFPAEMAKEQKELYWSVQKEVVTPIQEMVTFAKKLGSKKESLGIRMGLVSSAARQEILRNLKHIGLSDVFDGIVSGAEDLGSYIDPEGKHKPKPYGYLEVAKRLGINPAKCLVFEDTTAGVDAARTAGMYVIAVPYGWTCGHDFSKAQKVVIGHKGLPLQDLLQD